jgi:hypothetical protein
MTSEGLDTNLIHGGPKSICDQYTTAGRPSSNLYMTEGRLEYDRRPTQSRVFYDAISAEAQKQDPKSLLITTEFTMCIKNLSNL